MPDEEIYTVIIGDISGSKQLNGMDRCVRQQCDLTGTLHGQGQFPLVFGTVAGNPPGDDLAAFGNEIAQCFGIFVIYLQFTVYTEPADFAPMKSASFASKCHSSCSFHSQLVFRSHPGKPVKMIIRTFPSDRLRLPVPLRSPLPLRRELLLRHLR